MYPDFAFFIEIFGTIAFAMSGSFAAMQKRFDPFGVIIIAFVTSVGGGTVRDLLLDVPVFWMHDLLSVGLIFFTAVFTMIFKLIEKKFKLKLIIFFCRKIAKNQDQPFHDRFLITILYRLNLKSISIF